MSAVSVKSIWHERPAASLASLGLVSGLLSAAVGFTWRIELLEPLAGLFFLTAEMLPIGILFGAVVAGGIAMRTQRVVGRTCAAYHDDLRLERGDPDRH